MWIDSRHIPLCGGGFGRYYLLLFLGVYIINQSTVFGLPPGFRDEGVIDEKQTVGFNFVPSILSSSSKNESPSSQKYMMLATRKRGEIAAVLEPDMADGQSRSKVILDLKDKTCTDGERGLFQVLPHPNFVVNQYVYVFYTYDKHGGCKFSAVDGPVNAVSRFRLTATENRASTLALVDETMIFMSNPLPSKVHNGGDMKFGNDGNLYITLGNGGMSNEHGNAQKTNTLLGSIARITDDGRIPHDNPFQSSASDQACAVNGTVLPDGGRCSEIWAYGFRNPFRFSLDPNTEADVTRFHVNDVGGSFFEEVNLLTDTDGGKNYGYREREGPCSRMSNLDCSPVDPNEFTDPIFWYEHFDRTDAALTGGAFVPNGVWPESYDGKYLYADFIFQTIKMLEEDPSQACRDCIPPEPGFIQKLFSDMSDIGQPLQLTFGPYKDSQALYYSLWAPQGQFSIRRIIYEGNKYIGESDGTEGNNAGEDENVAESNDANISSSDSDSNGSGEDYEKEKKEDTEEKEPFVNSAPDAELRIDGQHVKKGQNYGVDQIIVFDASQSSDPDGDALVYSWNFGDGSGSTKVIQTHSFDRPGEYRIKLTVQDPHGFTNQISRLITIGKLPEPFIVYPWESLKFEVGDEMQLLGHATDGDGNYLDDSNLTWEVRQVHNTHYHPFLDPTNGNMIKAPPAPSPEDFHSSTNSFLRVLLTATDPKTNLTGTIIRDVMPETKVLYFGTDPPGLELTLDGFDVRTPEEKGVPMEVVTWINHNFTVDVKDQGGMVFQSWSDGAKERFSKIIVQKNPRRNAEIEVQVTKIARFVPLEQLEQGVIDIVQTKEVEEVSQLPPPHPPIQDLIDSANEKHDSVRSNDLVAGNKFGSFRTRRRSIPEP